MRAGAVKNLLPLMMAERNNEAPLAGKLSTLAGVTVRRFEPMARYTSMKIGGPADYFIEAAAEEGLRGALALLERYHVPFTPIGNGSNVLVSDRGVRGAVLRLTGEFRRADWGEAADTVTLRAGAACAMTQLVREAAQRGYGGLEFAEGIPGTVGGALFMNAGAYGSEMERVVRKVEGLTRGGEPLRLVRAEMTFTYRDSHLPAGTVITRVEIGLRKEPAARVKSRLHELVSRRKSSQPSGYPNSGSMFRNPQGDFAGRLIEAAGLKGKRLGQSQISERHANFIVNLGGAKAEDVRDLMELARSEVRRQFNVELTPEVRLVGEW